jgi:hypothetical protein
MPKMPFSFRRTAAFVGILILVFVLIEFNARAEELDRLNEQRDEMRVFATQAVQTQVSLQTQVAYAGSAAAVEEWARTEGHYMKDGDQPVVPLGQPGSEPVVSSTATPIPTPVQNWEVWWNLFFNE